MPEAFRLGNGFLAPGGALAPPYPRPFRFFWKLPASGLVKRGFLPRSPAICRGCEKLSTFVPGPGGEPAREAYREAMIPIRLVSTPSAALRWGASPSAELVLDDGEGTQRVGPEDAAAWTARALGPGFEGAEEWIRLEGSDGLRPGQTVVLADPAERRPAPNGRERGEEREQRTGLRSQAAGPSAAVPVIAGPRLVCTAGLDVGLELRIARGRQTVGRDGYLRVTDPSVSREHLTLTLDDAGLTASAPRGAVTVVRGDRMRPLGSDPLCLRPDDLLVLGAVHLRLETGTGSSLAEPGGPPAVSSPRPALSPPDARAASEHSTGLWRWIAAVSPVALSGVLAFLLASPTPLLFGLASLVSSAPLVLGARLRAREQRGQARQGAWAVAARRAAAAPCLPDLLSSTGPTVRSGSADESAAEGGTEWILTAGAAGEGASRLHSQTAQSSVLLRCGTVFLPGADEQRRLAPRVREASSASVPVPSLPVALGVPLRCREQAEPEECALPAPEFRVPSRDPGATLRLIVLSHASLGVPGLVLALHESSVPVEAAGLRGLAFAPSHEAVHVCERSDCAWGGRLVIRIASTEAAEPLNGRRWCADGVSVWGFRRLSRELIASGPSEPASGTGPGGDSCAASDPAHASPVLAFDAFGTPWSAHTEDDAGLHALGPHVFAVGTTGSGKTELIRTLIVSALREHPRIPWRLFLVDFKGGSGLSGFAGLPGVEDVVSDLGEGSVQRVLVSLAAEVRRREAWLAENGWPDLETAWQSLERAGRPAHPHEPEAVRAPADDLQPGIAAPPLLLIVIDELKAFCDSVEGAQDELARIAALGRSLGIRLLLASQRASGALTPALRANVATVLVLRPASLLEAGEFLDGPMRREALSWRPGTFAAVSNGAVSGPYRARPWMHLAAPEARCRPWGAERDESPGACGGRLEGAGENGPRLALARLAETLEVRREERSRAWARGWPRCVAPELPRPLQDALPAAPGGPGPLALVDDPARQRLLRLDGAGGHLLLCGQAGQGWSRLFSRSCGVGSPSLRRTRGIGSWSSSPKAVPFLPSQGTPTAGAARGIPGT